jgi:hypothetical protein
VEGETGSCSATCVLCAAGGTEAVGIKVEEAIDIKDEIPEAISYSEIKTEPEPEAISFSEIKTEPEVMLWGFL